MAFRSGTYIVPGARDLAGRGQGRLSTALTAPLTDAVEPVVLAVVARLASWGHECRRRLVPTSA